VLDWQEAHDEIEGIQESIETVDDQIKTAREELQAKLDPYGYDDVERSGEATEAIRNLENREQQREAAQQQDLDQATETIQEATEKIGALADERDEIFADLDLDSDDHDRLEGLCEQVEAYESAAEDVRKPTSGEHGSRRTRKLPGLRTGPQKQEIADLREDLREAERIAEDFDDLQSRLADIKAEIRQAKSDDQVENALAGA